MSTLERLAAALHDRYRIERELGAGGMATVYLAHDIRHDRDVAIKVLHPDLGAALGGERFLSEIKTTAKLQHPHILPLLDSGDAAGLLYYVMPVMTGETLRGRLLRERQLPIPEAVRIAREVASALDYAHRQGIIHRDIKPENILLHDGQALVADFGIALAVQQAGGARMTQTGLSLGTPSYMSPEQAMGERTIDARSDIYALGALTYEMLAGDPPFTGSTVQAIVARVLSEKPTPLHTLRDTVPPAVEHAVMTALAKLPADRFENAKQFADALANPAFATVAVPNVAVMSSTGWRTWLRDPRSWAALLALMLLGAISLPSRNDASDAGTSRVMRFTVEGPTDSAVLAIGGGRDRDPIVTSDGRMLAFIAREAAGSALYMRRLDSFELSKIADDATHAGFFSPDNAAIGFFRNSEVWKADLREPVPVRVGTLPEIWWDIRSAAWHSDGRILIAAARGLWAIPAAGGEPVLLVAADPSGRELFQHVSVLGDGRILLDVWADTVARTEVLSPNGKERRRILPGFAGVQIVDDVMFYGQEGQPRATFFDARGLQPTGTPIVLPELPDRELRVGRSIAWVDSLGVRDVEPVWVTTSGSVAAMGLPRAQYRWLRVSPDLSRVATGSFETLFSYVIRTGTRTRIAGDSEPVWSTDGRYVFASRGNRPFGGILKQVADGSRAADTLLALDRGDSWPTDVSPDSRSLAYYGATYGAGDGGAATDPNDLMFLDLTSKQSRRLQLPGEQRGGRFSPDGKWVAYQSTETGAEEVFVRPYPQLDAKYQISNGGGTEPLWARDGKTLYYRHRAEAIEVPIAIREGAIERGASRVLFTGNYATDAAGDQSWDIGADGRFLMLRPLPGERIDVHVTLNWIAEVRQRLQRAQGGGK